MVIDPLLNLGLGQTLDVLSGVGGGLATADINEVQTCGGLEQDLLVTGGIAKVAMDNLLDQLSGLGVIRLLSNDLLLLMNLLSIY